MRALLIIGLLGIAVPQPFQEGQDSRSPQEHQKVISQTPAPVTSPPPCCVPTPGPNQAAATGKTSYWKEAFEPPTLANWALVFVGIGATIAALCTLGVIRRQAQSMRYQTTQLRIAAEAARDSVKTMIASERAWIDGEIIGQEIPGVRLTHYSLNVTNHGKTAARVLGYVVHHGFLNEGADFSNETLDTHFSEEAYLLIGGGETKTIRNDWDMNAIYANPPDVLSRGAFRVTIRYRDIVSTDSVVHETKLHFIYKVFSSQLEPMYEYNDYK